jgi:undecaprenyl-diphosphatase
MTTFQAVIYSIVHGFTEFLPVSSEIHHAFISQVLGWAQPTGTLYGALSLGAFLSLFIYFRHDWASQISGFLQVILYRKKPMTLDERLSFFIFFTFIPLFLVKRYAAEELYRFNWNLLWTSIAFAAFAIPILMADHFSRKNRGMFDLNIVDSLLIGIIQILSLIPGFGRIGASLMGGFFVNYNRETCTKFALYISMPWLLLSSYEGLKDLQFHSPTPAPDVSWLTFYTIIIVTCLAGLLAIGGLLRNVQRGGFTQYMVYRMLVGAAMVGFLLIKGTA